MACVCSVSHIMPVHVGIRFDVRKLEHYRKLEEWVIRCVH